MSRITLSNQRFFDANVSETILEAARRNEILLEHSCRTGRCSSCKARVVYGDTHAIRRESSLTSDEVAAGWILTCCRSASSDVSLDIEDLGVLAEIKTQVLPCRIDSLSSLSTDVMKVGLRLPPTARFHYLSGQYIEIISKSGLRRSYSIANVATGPSKVRCQCT